VFIVFAISKATQSERAYQTQSRANEANYASNQQKSCERSCIRFNGSLDACSLYCSGACFIGSDNSIFCCGRSDEFNPPPDPAEPTNEPPELFLPSPTPVNPNQTISNEQCIARGGTCAINPPTCPEGRTQIGVCQVPAGAGVVEGPCCK